MLRGCCCEADSGGTLDCYGGEFRISGRKTSIIANKKQRKKCLSLFWEEDRKTRKGDEKQVPGMSMGAMPGLLGGAHKA